MRRIRGEEIGKTVTQLTDLTLHELWELFPISLAEHNPAWSEWYADEAAEVLRILPPEQVIRISHIGSTAVPGIRAKNIVDMLLEVPDARSLESAARALAAHGWTRMSESDCRISLNKGYTPVGFAERVYHLHLRVAGDNDELYFRDYLIEHPAVAKRYEELKSSLAGPYRNDRDGYTAAKSDFIARYTKAARESFPDRY